MTVVLRLLLTAALAAGLAASAERVTAAGKVVDAQGKPVDHATVLVYSADVKKGYNLSCPTCYADCGKRAVTGVDGSYTISGLSGDLLFNFLVARDGYGTKMIEKVDPANGVATAALDTRAAVPDPAQLIRGKVVDRQGSPVRDALIEQHGAVFPNGGRAFGERDWIDRIATTNEKGEFELAHSKPLKAMIVQISPRGMAPLLVTLPTGADPKPITVFEGAVVRGRLVQGGKPLANVQVGITSHDHNSQTFIPEVRLGTDEQGRFAFANVPAGRVFDLTGKMESLAPLGLSMDPVELSTKDNGQEVVLGDLGTRQAFTLRGKVLLKDSQPIPPHMRINISTTRSMDSQTMELGEDGSFLFKGLGRGVFLLGPGVRGYEVDGDTPYVELLVDGNLDDKKIILRRQSPRN